jgi:hypothetical protein
MLVITYNENELEMIIEELASQHTSMKFPPLPKEDRDPKERELFTEYIEKNI